MSDVIRLLPDSVANQIAAGEVIQRPASVIKELVENSVDAGATRIDINIKDAGRTLIQVIDNGCGMSATDARMAFERHATSKISCATDLFSLRTMGFRGEALPSIAAIARLEITTQRKDEPMGTRLLIEGSRVTAQEPLATASGTNLMVKDLFFNIPVRRRFLKKDSTEFAAIMREFERMAIVNPGIDFTLSHNGTMVSDLRGGPLLQRICALFGKDLNHKLIPLSADTSIVKISGYISLPEHSRRRAPLQYLFVNGRNMRHPYFHKAVLMCYSSLLPADVQPSYFINFTVDPSTIDVNIHPTKNEIKFEHEQQVWQILTSAVNESLGRYNAGPSIDFNPAEVTELPAFNGDNAIAAVPSTGTSAGYNPFHGNGMPSRPPRNWTALYDTFNAETPAATSVAPTAPAPSSLNFQQDTAPLIPTERQGMLDLEFELAAPTAMQVRNRYIVTPTSSGLLVIDQHRAHMLVLYHASLQRAARPDAVAAQKLMFPWPLEIPPSLTAHVPALTEIVAPLGFEIAIDEDGRHILAGAPPGIAESDAKELILKLVEMLAMHNGSDAPALDDLRRGIALSVAEAGAVKSGQPLKQQEIERITAALFALPDPSITPDGKRVFTTVDFDTIAQCLG